MTLKKTSSLKGSLIVLNEDQQSFTTSQIELLIAINECGSSLVLQSG